MSADSLLADSSGLVRDGQPVTDWPSIRRWVLARDGGVCQVCRISEANDVDHIWPRRLGGRDHIDNLRAACGPCNKAKGGRVSLEAASTTDLIQGVQTLTDRAAEMTREGSVLAAYALMHDLRIEELSWLAATVNGGRHALDIAAGAVQREVVQRTLIERVPDAEVVEFPAVPAAGAA
jgi:hypothetical protein